MLAVACALKGGGAGFAYQNEKLYRPLFVNVTTWLTVAPPPKRFAAFEPECERATISLEPENTQGEQTPGTRNWVQPSNPGVWIRFCARVATGATMRVPIDTSSARVPIRQRLPLPGNSTPRPSARAITKRITETPTHTTQQTEPSATRRRPGAWRMVVSGYRTRAGSAWQTILARQPPYAHDSRRAVAEAPHACRPTNRLRC